MSKFKVIVQNSETKICGSETVEAWTAESAASQVLAHTSNYGYTELKSCVKLG